MSGFDDPIPPGAAGRVNLVEALSVAQHLPAEAIDLALRSPARVAGAVLAALARAADGAEPTPREANLVFWGVHVLAALRDPRLCAPLLRLLRRPGEAAHEWLGDAIPATLPSLVIGGFDGDAPALLDALCDREADEFVRYCLFGALAFLAQDGAVDRETLRAFLERFDDERLARAGDAAWEGWADAIALGGFDDLAPRVEAARADARLLDDEEEPNWFDELMAEALARPDDPARFAEFGLGPPGDVVAELDAALRSDDDDVVAPEPAHNPLRDVGRNDPCPCGSGRKFKKCCLPAGG